MSFESVIAWLKENTWVLMLAVGALIGAAIHIATGGGPWPYPNRFAFTGCLTEPSAVGSVFDFIGFYGAHTVCFLCSTALGAILFLVLGQVAIAAPSALQTTAEVIADGAVSLFQGIFQRKQQQQIRAEDGFDIERGFDFYRVSLIESLIYRLRRIGYAYALSDALQNTAALSLTVFGAVTTYSLTSKAICYSQSNTAGGVFINFLLAGLFIGIPVFGLKFWYFRPRTKVYRELRSQLPRLRDVASYNDGSTAVDGCGCSVHKKSSGEYVIHVSHISVAYGTSVRIFKKNLYVLAQRTWHGRAIGHVTLNGSAKNLLISEVVAYAKACREAFDAWQIESLDVGVGSDYVQVLEGHVYPEYQWRLRPGLHHRDGRAVEWRDVSPQDIGRLLTEFPKSIFRCPAGFVVPDTVVDPNVGEGYVRVLDGLLAAGDQWKLKPGLRHKDGRDVEWRDAEDSIIGRPLSDFPKSLVRRPVAPSTSVTEAPVTEGEAQVDVGEGTLSPAVPSSEDTPAE